MAQFRSAVVTAKGKELILQAIENKEAVVFTSLKVGSGVYAGSENLENVTGLKQVKNSFSLSSVQRIDGNTIKVAAAVKNDEVAIGYNMTEYGIYAKLASGPEVLVCIATAINADYLPDFAASPVTVLVEMYIKLTNSAEARFEYTTPAGLYATIAELEAKADKVIIDSMLDIKQALLQVVNWQKVGQFWQQEVNVAGITAASNPILVEHLDINSAPEAVKVYKKNYACVAGGVHETKSGAVLFKVLKKPVANIVVGLKGV